MSTWGARNATRPQPGPAAGARPGNAARPQPDPAAWARAGNAAQPQPDPAAGARPGDGEAAILFSALADPTRRQVVQLLGTRPRRAGELAAATGMSGPAMSRHLRVLLRAGLVADERPESDARARLFRLRPQSLLALQAWLDQLRARWDEQLAAFKRHIDERPQG